MERRPENVDLPDCWNDELTMSALFSPIRKATVNPLDKAYKMRFWKPLIENWCMQNKCSFTLSDLRKAFERNGKTPACLEEITHVMLRKCGISETDFQEIPSSQKECHRFVGPPRVYYTPGTLPRWVSHRALDLIVPRSARAPAGVGIPLSATRLVSRCPPVHQQFILLESREHSFPQLGTGLPRDLHHILPSQPIIQFVFVTPIDLVKQYHYVLSISVLVHVTQYVINRARLQRSTCFGVASLPQSQAPVSVSRLAKRAAICGACPVIKCTKPGEGCSVLLPVLLRSHSSCHSSSRYFLT
uniref:Uncharacterized protein n=1 Tax=Timema genevievae TaxID=629358 RepID=A0A7R9PKI8_TIMGE|nr:unnamed protein product [Timema genevievae]